MHQLTPHRLRRLALVRRLYDSGVQQSHQPEPMASLALMSFHEAIEMYLQLLCEHRGVGTKRPEFMDYFKLLEEDGLRLEEREAMRRLNAARVNLKHQGILPAAVEVEGFRASTTNFLHNNAQAGFGVDFARISLAAVIPHQAIRELLESADAALAELDHQTALSHAATAFTKLMTFLNNGDPETGGRPAFSLSRSARRGLTFFRAHELRSEVSSSAASAIERVADGVNSVVDAHGEAITVIGLGLDFKNYLLFKSNGPAARPLVGGAVSIQWLSKATDDPDIARRCVNFVIDVALRLLPLPPGQPEPRLDVR